MAVYKHIFFDLDHTLWDFETNSRLALEGIFKDHLNPLSTSFDGFHSTYLKVNQRYWEQYRVGNVTKEELRIGRFRDSLQQFGFEDEVLSETLADQYVKRSPYQTALFPDALETLQELQNRGYEMHIITNGFEEVQHVKIRESGLAPFFKKIITSEQVAVRKPHPNIFSHALEVSSANVVESIMIGDSLQADIVGAMNFGMDQIFFNPSANKHAEKPTFEIRELKELREIF